MANWKMMFEDAKVMLYALALLVVVMGITIFWLWFLVILIPVAFVLGWISRRHK